MAGNSRDEDREDLDWLYRRDDAVDPTRIYSDQGESERDAAEPGRRRASFSDPGDPARSRTRSGLPSAGRPAASRDQRARSRPAAPPPPPADRAPRDRRPRRGGHPVRRTVVIVVLAWLLFMIGTPVYAWTQVDKVDAMPTDDRPANTPGTLWVLIGTDSREGLYEAQRERLSTGSAEGKRTDTIMLLYRPTFGSPALISLPRDSFVDIPGHGQNKINAAYAIGGAPLLVQTIEENTGLRVDRFGEIGFGGFSDMVDAVGGIEICPDRAIEDERAGLDIAEGCQDADGPTALGYVRTRYTDATGDLARTARQREVIGEIARKVVSPVTLLNPLRWWGVNMAAADSFGVDDSAGPLGIALMGTALLGTSGDGLTLVVPISNPDARTSAGSSVLWDDDQAQVMWEAIAAGDTGALEQFRPEN